MELQSAEEPDLLVYYPHLPSDFKATFYSSMQSEGVPVCVIRPQTAEAVAFAVRSVREHRCAFGIKSGGHGTARGASNLHNGLVLDLKYLSQIKVSTDRETVSVGPASTWIDVYSKLEPQGLLVAGGRVSTVGVGGFTLGGKAFVR